MQLKFNTVLAILPILPSIALAACYLGKPAWTDLATEKQVFKAFRKSCERIQGKHSRGVSTCDPANGDSNSVEGGSYFLSIEPYAKGEYDLSVDTCLLLAGEVSETEFPLPNELLAQIACSPSSLPRSLGSFHHAPQKCKMLIFWA